MTLSSLDTHVSTSTIDGEQLLEAIVVTERDPAPPLPTGALNTEKIPPAVAPQPLPLIRILMPLMMLVMVGGMLALMLTVGGPPHPMMLMFPVMILLSMATMFSGAPGDDIDETRRTYLRHLGAIRNSAMRNAEQQRAAELHKHPDPQHLTALIGTRRMWERQGHDPDAMEVRIGLGTTALCTPVKVADSGAPEDLDPVCAVALRHTVRTVGSVPAMPIAVQLQAFRYVHIGGIYAEELARSILIQLAFHHGPETLGFKVIGTNHDWMKWLPHQRDPESAQFRILLVTEGAQSHESELDSDEWATIIGIGMNEHSELAERAISEGFALTVGADDEHTLTVHTEGGLEDIGSADLVTEAQAVQCARKMTAFRRPTDQQQKNLDFLGLHGWVDVASIGPAQLWSEGRDLPQQLNVPIGVSDRGAPVWLDIKEAAHGGVGPHGLCVGATGSGKSEMLRTFVLSLALTHSPDDLNFVLVDFKGGATFLGLEKLPHTSAVITNLAEEASLVERMHDAISGELNRRQEMLRAAGNFANVQEYRAARASSMPHLPPMPALVIVLDEFSELLGQHPDFADLFVAVGRLGRSLHMHLLLASQRLEEGRLRGLDSHLSYRIGLKTFSPSESRQVLGIVDAYHLPAQPGAGFLKTDASDVTRFQASYVSGPVPVTVASEKQLASSVRRFTGFDREEVEEEVHFDTSRTVLGSLAEVIIAAGELGRYQAHQLWLPPLPDELPLAGVADQVGENQAAIGMVDRPFLQQQDPFIVDLSAGAGHTVVCGGPRSGKTNAVRTLVLSLAATHPTESVRFYVLDLAGSELAPLASVPHVAGLAHKSDPEKVRRIVDEVLGFVERPESRHTYLVVDGWHSVAADFEDLYDAFVAIAADGLAARVHLVLTTPRWTQIRPAIRDLLGTRIELKLGEAMDSVVDRKAQLKLPDKPGRGLSDDGEQILIARSTNQDIGHVIMASRSAGMEPVPRLKLLPTELLLSEVDRGEGIILGIGGRDLVPLGWQPEISPHLLCFGGQGSGKTELLRTLAHGIAQQGREHARLIVLDPRRSHLDEFPEEMIAAYAATSDAMAAAITSTATTLRQRLPGPDVTAAQLSQRSWWQGPELYVLIDDADLISDNILHPLVELIPHARDIGLHIVVARKSGGVGRALYTQFYAAIKDNSPSLLLLDADPEEGRIFGMKPAKQIPGRGQWQVAGTTVGPCQVARKGQQ